MFFSFSHSRNIFAGFLAALYYFTIHNDATRIHTNPAARENFAFPFVLCQIYFLTVWIEQHNRYYQNIDDNNQKDDTSPLTNERIDQDDRTNHFKVAFFTAFAILAWDFSTYIFASQIFIILFMVKMRLVKRRHLFLQNFILAHIMARLIANNVVRYGWIEIHQKPMNFDCLALITLLLYIVQKYPTKQQRLRTIERIVLRLVLLLMVLMSTYEFLSEQNFYSEYMDIMLTKLYLKEPSFSTLLNLCRQDYKFIDFATLNVYNSLFVSKILIIFMLTWAANWFKNRRQVEENSDEHIQRAKNYLLEDYLEENKLTMTELAKIERNQELHQCMKLLESFKYDYERYKCERRRMLEDELRGRPLIEREAFLDEVKKFKNEISEKELVNSQSHSNQSQSAQKQSKQSESESLLQNDNEFSAISGDENMENESIEHEDSAENDEVVNEIEGWQHLFEIERPEYFYNLVQTTIFAVITILMYKVKYVLTPFLCIIATTFPPKSLIPRNFSLRIVYAIVIGSCIIDRGVQNMREQLNLKDTFTESGTTLEESNLLDMLKWIKSNTDRTDVFAGPDDIISLVLLATGRPIANNPLNNHPLMR